MRMLLLLLWLQLVAIVAVNIQLKKLNMTTKEYADAVGAIADQLVKVMAEILAELQNFDQVPQSAIDKLTRAQEAAQALDNLNPDQPTPAP